MCLGGWRDWILDRLRCRWWFVDVGLLGSLEIDQIVGIEPMSWCLCSFDEIEVGWRWDRWG